MSSLNIQGDDDDVFRTVSGTELYAITVKVLKDPKNADEKAYEPFFKTLYHLTEVVLICSEKDMHGRLHYHGVIRIKTKFFRKSICLRGFHVKLVKIYNAGGWLTYCFKNDIYSCFETNWDKISKELLHTVKKA